MRGWRILFGLAVLGYLYVGLRPLPELPLPGRSDLVAHALTNAALAALAIPAFPSGRALRLALVAIAVLGGAIELLQGFAPGRTPSFADALANVAGVLAVAAAQRAMRGRVRTPRR